jgi:hypothetical protein
MKVFIIIITLLTLQNMAKAGDLKTITAPDAHGDSIHEVLTDMESEEQCLDAVDMAELAEAEIEEAAIDQCMDQAY